MSDRSVVEFHRLLNDYWHGHDFLGKLRFNNHDGRMTPLVVKVQSELQATVDALPTASAGIIGTLRKIKLATAPISAFVNATGDGYSHQHWREAAAVIDQAATQLAPSLGTIANLPPPRGTATITMPINKGPEFLPASAFPKDVRSLLRMAAGNQRKTKKVRSRRVDGVKMYNVEDARRWWPERLPESSHRA